MRNIYIDDNIDNIIDTDDEQALVIHQEIVRRLSEKRHQSDIIECE